MNTPPKTSKKQPATSPHQRRSTTGLRLLHEPSPSTMLSSTSRRRKWPPPGNAYFEKPTCSLFSSGPFSVGLANFSHLQTQRIASSFSSSNSPRSLLQLLDLSRRQLLPHWFKTYAMESKEEEEYVLLDLDSVSSQFEIPPNAPYSFSGLNTEHPVLTIGDKLKLIGEYQETIGTCLIFKEEEMGPSEANLFAGKCIMDPNQSPSKQVKPVTSLQRILKFRLAPNLESHDPPEQSRDPVLHTVQSVAE